MGTDETEEGATRRLYESQGTTFCTNTLLSQLLDSIRRVAIVGARSPYIEDPPPATSSIGSAGKRPDTSKDVQDIQVAFAPNPTSEQEESLTKYLDSERKGNYTKEG